MAAGCFFIDSLQRPARFKSNDYNQNRKSQSHCTVTADRIQPDMLLMATQSIDPLNINLQAIAPLALYWLIGVGAVATIAVMIGTLFYRPAWWIIALSVGLILNILTGYHLLPSLPLEPTVTIHCIRQQIDEHRQQTEIQIRQTEQLINNIASRQTTDTTGQDADLELDSYQHAALQTLVTQKQQLRHALDLQIQPLAHDLATLQNNRDQVGRWLTYIFSLMTLFAIISRIRALPRWWVCGECRQISLLTIGVMIPVVAVCFIALDPGLPDNSSLANSCLLGALLLLPALVVMPGELKTGLDHHLSRLYQTAGLTLTAVVLIAISLTLNDLLEISLPLLAILAMVLFKPAHRTAIHLWALLLIVFFFMALAPAGDWATLALIPLAYQLLQPRHPNPFARSALAPAMAGTFAMAMIGLQLDLQAKVHWLNLLVVYLLISELPAILWFMLARFQLNRPWPTAARLGILAGAGSPIACIGAWWLGQHGRLDPSMVNTFILAQLAAGILSPCALAWLDRLGPGEPDSSRV